MTDVSAPSQALEQFVLLAKSARGAAAAELVRQALDAPGVYVFAELLDMPHIKEVSLLFPLAHRHWHVLSILTCAHNRLLVKFTFHYV